MKISVNGQDLFEISDMVRKVICNDVHEDAFEEDMKRRLQFIINDKYENCFRRLKAEWDEKLVANGIKALPVDRDEYCNLVFSQPNYMCRKDRDSVQN